MFMGKPSGMPAGQYPHPDWPGAVYWTANQTRVNEFSTDDGTTIVRSYLSDTGSLTHYTFSPNATSKVAQAWWLKGGDPLPGRAYNAWSGKLPFAALGLSKDFILSQLKASPAIKVRDLGKRTIRGEACEGIEVSSAAGVSMPDESPAELWFSVRHSIAWQVDCTVLGGSDRYSLGVSNAQPWTPDAGILALPSGFKVADMRK